MSRIYDNWEKLVGAVLNREELRGLAHCESFSSSISTDFNPRRSFDSGQHAVSRSSSQKINSADLCSQKIFFSHNVLAIDHEEIKKATKNFEADMLGNGGFGPVFKGWIDEHHLTAAKPGSGIAVAIKKLNNKGIEGQNEWVDEIRNLSQLHHPNLIKLIGYSFDTYNRFLVYEFMPKGSLDNHLFRRGHQSLPWLTRIKVALGVARGLSFLHGLEIPVIHGNIKCSDILLDDDLNTKLSNFGLPKNIRGGDTSIVSAPAIGTYGYAAPEYIATGELTMKCDVYAFGVVLIELMSGLQVINRKHNLMDWVKPYLGERRKLLLIMDTRLEAENLHEEAYKVAKIALQCVSSNPRLRPTMAEVLTALQQL